MPGVVRLGDDALVTGHGHCCTICPHVCVGPTINGSTNVFVNSMPAIRQNDPGIHAACCGANTYKSTQGSPNVFVNSKPLCRLNDQTLHCNISPGKFIGSSANVFANG